MSSKEAAIETGHKSTVSVILPCRNEEAFIAHCLESILANEHPEHKLEILVIDGMSTDRTRDVVKRYASRYPFIRLLDNPRKTAPAALNIGIAAACGDILIRLDAHAVYDSKYIMNCLKGLDQYGADNVGGTWRILPRNNTFFAKAIARVLSHWFGAGNAHYRLAKATRPKWVDTVPFFCCRKELFQRIGLFNEALTRTQDIEFNHRITKAGGRILLLPEVVTYYYARSDFRSFLRHNWFTGMWVALPFLYSNVIPVSWRHLTPLAFVSSLLLWAVLSPFWAVAAWAFVVLSGLYCSVALVVAAQVAVRERDIRYALVLPLVFAGLHLSYGLGSLRGLVKVLTSVWRNKSPKRQGVRSGAQTSA